MTDARWAVVLAGGDGERVSALTRDASGQTVPKQYWPCDGRVPMLRWALARARRIAPAAGVLVVVNENHRRFWQRELADVPSSNLLIQPCNRGTAVGVLFALLEVQARGGADATVALLPSDHYVADEAVLHRALLTAVREPRQQGRSVVLLGMTPIDIDSSYGWILPAARAPIAAVSRFVEKPPIEVMAQLVARGALVNSFILVARTRDLLALFEQTRPDVLKAFWLGMRGSPAACGMPKLYEGLPAVDMSRDVLERGTHALSVVQVPPCGWSDLGTPDRLRLFLAWSWSTPPEMAGATAHPATAA